MKCSIVKDLLSNYIDGLCGEETVADIKEHLEECEECRVLYEKMSEAIPQEVPPEEKDVDFLKKLRKRIVRRNVTAAAIALLVALVGFLIFANNYEIPIPFDPNRMWVETFKAGIVREEDGRLWLEEIEPGLLGDLIPEDENVIDAIRLSYRGFRTIGGNSRGRTINREGKEIRVIYYCYTKSLLNSMFVDPDLLDYSESGASYGSDIYGDSFESGYYEPQMKEIYYLPMRNLHKLDELSDEEFDQLREKCQLIWSGVV